MRLAPIVVGDLSALGADDPAAAQQDTVTSGSVSAATAFGDVNLIRMGSERVEPGQAVDEHDTGWPGHVGAAAGLSVGTRATR